VFSTTSSATLNEIKAEIYSAFDPTTWVLTWLPTWLERWLQQVLSIPLNPSKRLYWGYLLASVVIVGCWWAWHHKRPSWRRIYRTFLDPSYWFNRSSAVDAGLLFTNTALRVAILVPLFGSHLFATIWVARTLNFHFDSPPILAVPAWSVMLMYTAVFFILEDFSRFYLHRVMHRVPWLWRFHRVHHSATNLTPLTLHRIHPLEMSLYYCRGLIVFAGVSGVFVYFAGKKLSGLSILGVDALGFIFNLIAANLRHSNIRLGFGRFERWFISPAQHQIHHSAAAAHRDRNFGTCLAVWDRYFNSWTSSFKVSTLRFGLSE